MLQNFNTPGCGCNPYTIRAFLDGEVIAQGECEGNAFTHMAGCKPKSALQVAYKACYDAIPAEYENRIDEIEMVSQWGDEIPLSTWLKFNNL